MENKPLKLIHVGRMLQPGGNTHYLLLRQKAPHEFVWYEMNSNGNESETAVSANTVEEAIRLANRTWKESSFRPLMCGFRYTLPERDEHGINALFHQMVSSYNSMNGIYFDEESGHSCFVQNASQEAREFWQKLKKENKI